MSQALALKYRPTRFEDLIGQDAISQTLSLALDSNRLSHAYLFSGLRGSGKTSSARIFAKALNCEKGPSSTPCDTCENCLAAKEGRHIDIIEMDAASSRKIDDIRDLIEQTKYRPAMARFKIFIIDEVHMLTKEAFNALLKTLEEPPPCVKFILATTDPLKLPATILSRTQHFRFKKIAHRDVLAHIQKILHLENVPFEAEALEMITRSGGGSLRDTLTLLDQAIIFCKGTLTQVLVAQMLGLVDPALLERLFEAILSHDEESLSALLKELETYETEMILEEIAIFLKDKLAQNHPQFPLLMLERFFRIIADSHVLLSLNSHNSFVLMLTILKMKEALKIKEIDEMISELELELFNPHKKPLTPVQSATPATISTGDSQPVQESPVESAPQKEHSTHMHLFETLKIKLYDRNYELGECFSQHVSFVSFDNRTLNLQSNAQESCRDRLRIHYSVIKNFIKEIFGVDTIIKVENIEPTDTKTPSETPAPTVQEENRVEIEESGGASGCVASMLDTPQDLQKSGERLLESELASRAKELLDVKKIIMLSKT
ncbi:MAG: DNA polymerase III subunit gamma/tau [Wolinella sp.]